jgi:hypothetical protein
LKNLSDTYTQWATVKYDILRNKATAPALEDLVREIIAEEFRIQTSASDANFTKNKDKGGKKNEGKKDDDRPICHDCKMANKKSYNHDPKKCWIKHPDLKPDWMKEKEQNKQKKSKEKDSEGSQNDSQLQLLATSVADKLSQWRCHCRTSTDRPQFGTGTPAARTVFALIILFCSMLKKITAMDHISALFSKVLSNLFLSLPPSAILSHVDSGLVRLFFKPWTCPDSSMRM